MKKTSLTIWTLVFCGCLLLSGHFLYGGTPLRAPVTGSTYRPAVRIGFASPLLRSPLSLLFPFESFSHEVCRRPAFTFPLPHKSLDNYRYSGMFFKARPVAGSHYIQINENLMFKKGNSFLLVPHTFTLPVRPDIRHMPIPSMNLPRAD